MQTILVVQCALPGAVYLNGRPAGETDAERPLTLPVSPFGPLLLELRPFSAGILPLTLRIPFSKGIPLLPEADRRMCAALWPGGIVEIELLPERVPRCLSPVPFAQSGGFRFSFLDESPPALLCEGPAASFRHPLPDGALMPSLTPLPAGFLLAGPLADDPEEQYAVVLAPDASAIRLSVTGRSLSLTDGGAALQILRAYGDTAGHAALETWTPAQAGWSLAASEPMWLNGAPHRPETPAETALAAMEAAQLGLMSEAASYFSPVFPFAEVLARAAGYDGCTLLRYPLPDGTPAVGLIRLQGGLLTVIPARCAAVPGGTVGSWQLTGLEIDERA